MATEAQILATRNPQLATRNPQLPTRNPQRVYPELAEGQRVTRNSQHEPFTQSISLSQLCKTNPISEKPK